MVTKMKIDDLRCVACGGETLLSNKNKEDSLWCPSCNAVNEFIWGVPFIGKFEADDLLGLIEISANIPNRGNFGVNPETVEKWEKLLSDYHQAEDKADFIRITPEAQSPYLLNRYGEWVEVTHLINGMSLDGLQVLDIGAGLGFDSYRLSMRGAKVTAIEFSPILFEAGKQNFPDIRWIGGFSHCLPFKNNSFDMVFCNAALHHMKDIPAAISEALRVLRPNGKMITTCDSFRPSDAGDDFELKIFDQNPTVLLGVNEGVPKFSDFVSVLQQHSDILETEIFTHTLYGGRFSKTIKELTSWNLVKDGKMLAKRSGSLALRVTLKAPWPICPSIQVGGVLCARDYASTLHSESSALTNLIPLMPPKYVDLPFPGNTESKFELLNGWRLKKTFHHGRIAFKRGRWFLKRPEGPDALTFDLKLPSDATESPANITVFLNGEKSASYHVDSLKWTPVSINLSEVFVDQIFVIEIQMQEGRTTLETASFMVRNRNYMSLSSHKRGAQNTPVVYAIIPVFNRIHFTLACIKDLKNQTHSNIQIIVADGGSTDGTADKVQEQFEDVIVLTTKIELWWTGAMAMGIDHVLATAQGNDNFVLMMNNDTQIQENYVESLLTASKMYDAAVGSVVVDSRDPSQILDAGEYIDWKTYLFPVNTTVEADEQFRDDVDVLPGRGSLIPLEMIRSAGNVDPNLLPHYLADYEFFYRLKKHGFRLGVYCEPRLLAHIEETGIIPSSTATSFHAVFKELFSRRSMTNVVDHWRFVGRHAPKKMRTRVRLILIMRAVGVFMLRTPLRPIGLPLFWLYRMPFFTVFAIKSQFRQFLYFFKKIKEKRSNIFCHPEYFPSLIRLPIYFCLSPGPLKQSDFTRYGLKVDELLEQNIIRSLSIEGHYALEISDFSGISELKKLQRLFWSAWNPLRKIYLLIRFIKEL